MLFLGSFVNALVDVLAIIGIILVGGFLIFFLGDLVLSVLDPNYTRFGRKNKDKKEKQDEKSEEKEEVKALPEVEQETVEALPFKAEEKVEEPVEEFKFDEPEEKSEEVKEIEQAKEDALADLRAEEEIFKANMLKSIEERQAKKEEAKESKYDEFFFGDGDLTAFDDEEENFEGIEIQPEEQPEEAVEEPAEEQVEEVVEEQPEEVAEEVVEETSNEELEELKRQLEEERRKFEEEKARLISENEELSKKLSEEPVVETLPAGSVEEYETRLATLKERLTANEKELRKVKKEFLPLRKVARTLESDEKKLRRKEAIVAKQKVVLYGVNNIGDIDEEKAKKLEEDLDILEGFRLSVQHCEEVMAANKDRYPILERTYNILTENNETLKKDIEETENAIAALKVETPVEETATETTDSDADNK